MTNATPHTAPAAPGGDRPRTPREFERLLDRCRAQVEADPEGVVANPHLYGLLHRIYLRLCHGNIPDFGELDDGTAEA